MNNNASPRKVLLVKTSSLGDVIHNLPVATLLRHALPQSQIDWLVEEAFADIPRLHPGIERVIPVALRRWRRQLLRADTWREMAAFRRLLREEAYDLVLDTQGLIKSAVLARQARLAPGGRCAGFDALSAREPLAARGYHSRLNVPRALHAVTRNLQLAARAVNVPLDAEFDYGILPAARKAGSALDQWRTPSPYALLITASSRSDKSWAIDNWQRLAAHLIGQGLTCILPAGTAVERENAGRLAHRLGDSAYVAPPLRLRDIAQLSAEARLIIGVDTGLTHLGVALGRPTLCLFAGSDPELTGVHHRQAQLARNLGRRGHPASVAEACALVDELARLAA